MLPIRGKQALAFRLVAIPVAATLAAHFVIYRRFPWEAGYQFPGLTVGIIAGIMLCCWEVNLGVFRWLDHRMPFYQNPVRRISRQVLVGGLLTALTFVLVFGLITRLIAGVWPSVNGFSTGLFVCFGIASLINGIYVGLYLLRLIYGPPAATVDQLNARLTQPSPGPAPADLPSTVVDRPADGRILIESGKQLLRLKPTEIAYFYAAGGLVQLVRSDGERLTTSYDALSDLTNRLPTGQFFQISRQLLVQPGAVLAVRDEVNRKLCLTLAPGLQPGHATELVIISRYRAAEFRKWFMASTAG